MVGELETVAKFGFWSNFSDRVNHDVHTLVQITVVFQERIHDEARVLHAALGPQETQSGFSVFERVSF